MVKLLPPCKISLPHVPHAFTQICDEKTGITVLKRLSHGGLDASASVVDVSTTPVCCTTAVGALSSALRPSQFLLTLITPSASAALVRNPGFCPPSARNMRDVGDDAM